MLLAARPEVAAAATIHVAPGAVDLAPGDDVCGLVEAILNAETGGDVSDGDCAAGSAGADVVELPPGATYMLDRPFDPSPVRPAAPAPPPGPFRGYFPIALRNRGGDASGLPPIRTAVTIRGNPAELVRDASPSTPDLRFFTVDGGALTLEALTLRGGRVGTAAFSGRDLGGAVLVRRGSLHLVDCNVMDNQAASGGGIYMPYADTWPGPSNRVTLTRGFVHGNRATHGVGGGIALEPYTDLMLESASVTSNTADSGGGIWSEIGRVTLVDTLVRGNSAAGDGAGIHAVTWDGGLLDVTGGDIEWNAGDGDGGGLFVLGPARLRGAVLRGNRAVLGAAVAVEGGTLELDHVSVVDNAAIYKYAGLYARGYWPSAASRSDGPAQDLAATAVIADSTIRGNIAEDGPCGGICVEAGRVEVLRSTVADNVGGGLMNLGGAVTVHASTLSGNVKGASEGHGAGLAGNGVYNTGAMEIRWSTVVSNVGSGDLAFGHGIVSHTPPASLRLRASIVAGHTTGTDCAGTAITSDGGNLAGDGSCPFGAPGDQARADPRLGPLADNGGPTWTHALQDGSPALDRIAGGSPGCGDGTPDQRGMARPRGARCDVGAFER